MNVLVDTPVWSFALRRNANQLSNQQRDLISDLASLIHSGGARLLGMVRQEILSGISDRTRFERIRNHLRGFPDIALSEADYETAAEVHNRCRAQGITATPVDALLCATALRRDWSVFTTDRDFSYYARLMPLRLHGARPHS